MERSEYAFANGFFCGAVFMAIVLTCLVFIPLSNYYSDKAIKHGAAQYNATTGAFEWKETK